MKLLKDTIIPPAGFKAEGFFSGIKKTGLDTALIFSSVPCTAAGTFTTNRVKAFCVERNAGLLETGSSFRGIAVNSGNANACTGKKGKEGNVRFAEAAAALEGVSPDEVLTASTGVIGVDFPIEKIEDAVKGINSGSTDPKEGFLKASEAILTTDTFKKNGTVQFEAGGKKITLSGMAKGSGMIHPNMATMLAFLTTDLSISPEMLSKALKNTVEETFNMVSVDGDTSTNDMVLILANGEAENPVIDKENADFEAFSGALSLLSRHLAKSIAADGEGATKLLEIEVTGAKSLGDARKIARSVSSSNLVKTAFFGMDPNWGRILAAMGYSGADFNPEGVSIYFQAAPGYACLMDNGTPHHFDKDSLAGILKEKNIIVTIKLSDGDYSATAWSCDFSYDYVRINAEYTT